VRARDLFGARILDAARTAAASVPDGRDLVVDLVRGGSLAVVVLGHTMMAVVTWEDDVPQVGNLLAEVPALQLLTWLLQVMPAFFAAGAVANSASWSSAVGRGEPWRCWMWSRTRRLLRPVVWYLLVWVPLVLVLRVAAPSAAGPLGMLSTQLLWFLGVYVVVVALTPLERRLAASRWWSVVGLLAAAGVVDMLRFGGELEALGALNLLVVWVLAAVCGLVVRERAGAWYLWLVAAAAFAANAVAVWAGPYPLSMVGMPGEEISNMSPPTFALALHSVALVSLLGALWPTLARWCERARVRVATCVMGGVAMSLYLWHLTALVAVVVAQHELGLDRPALGDPWFWPSTVAYLAVTMVVVLVVVSLAAPLEYLPLPWVELPTSGGGPARSVAAVASVVTLGTGLLVLALCGMGRFPFEEVRFAGVAFNPAMGLAMVAAGLLLGRIGGATPPYRAGR